MTEILKPKIGYRKLWLGGSSLAVIVLLLAGGAIDGAEFVSLFQWVFAITVGGNAVEHLSKRGT